MVDFVDRSAYLGYAFEIKMREQSEYNKITGETEKVLRERCRNFLDSLFKQLKQRLPESVQIMEKNKLIFG